MITKLEADVKLLMDQTERTTCIHYTGHEEQCIRPGNNERFRDNGYHMAYNCDGDIRNCNFPLEWLDGEK